MQKGLCWATASLLFLSACSELNAGAAGGGVTVANTPVPGLKGTVSFDVVEIDQTQNLLYATDRTDSGVDVFDVTQAPGQYLRTITVPGAPNGLAVAPDLGRVFVGLENGSLAIIDAKTSTVVKQVSTGEKSLDLIDYAPSLHRVFASSGVAGNIVSIDGEAGSVLDVFKIGLALEQPRFNPADASLYVASPDAAALYQLDPDTGKVKRKLTVGGGCISKGLAINPKQDQAVIACGNGVVRFNLRNTGDAEIFNQVTDGDIVSYDSKSDRFLVAAPARAKVAGEIGIFGGNPIAYVTSVRLPTGGTSATYDEAGNTVYAADIGAGKAGISSFKLPTGDMPITVPPSMVAEFAGVIAAVVLVLFVVGRLADPIRRPQPLPRRRRV